MESGATGGKEKGATLGAKEAEPAYYTVGDRTSDRTFFIVDLTRLQRETDTLEGATVVYRPEADLKRRQYEQRCSQLVGLSLCAWNFTGKYPEYVRLKGTGYAIMAFGQHCIMGLSGRPDEPQQSTVQHLKCIANFFHFYYHSPQSVRKVCQGDWEIFTRSMSTIFTLIVSFLVLQDPHSVPAMFLPLPYVNTDHCRRDGARLFLLANRVLRACQQHDPIIGGCIMHGKEILCSQLPLAVTEKLLLVAAGGVELNTKSILEDNITPEKVWVIEIFLTQEEDDLVEQTNPEDFQNAYATLDPNPSLTTSALNWRFQSVSSNRGRGQWRRRIKRSSSSHDASPTKTRLEESTDSTFSFISPVVSDSPPPLPPRNYRKPPPSPTAISEKAVSISPGLSSVSFSTSGPVAQNVSHSEATIKGSNSEREPHSGSSASSSEARTRRSVYSDDFVSSLQNPLLMQTATTSSRPIASPPIPASNRSPEADLDAAESRQSTGSSDSFATPSPTPPGESMPPPLPPRASRLLAVSYDTERSSSFLTASESAEGIYEDIEESTRSTLKRGSESPGESPQERAVRLPQTASRPGLFTYTSTPVVSKTDALPSNARNWRFKFPSKSDSDDDDFVDSTELQEMLERNRQAAEEAITALIESKDAEKQRSSLMRSAQSKPGNPDIHQAVQNPLGSSVDKVDTASDEQSGKGREKEGPPVLLPNGDAILPLSDTDTEHPPKESPDTAIHSKEQSPPRPVAPPQASLPNGHSEHSDHSNAHEEEEPPTFEENLRNEVQNRLNGEREVSENHEDASPVYTPDPEKGLNGALVSDGKVLVSNEHLKDVACNIHIEIQNAEESQPNGSPNDPPLAVIDHTTISIDLTEGVVNDSLATTAGMRTPVEMTLNESILAQTKLNDSGEYDSSPGVSEEGEGEKEEGGSGGEGEHRSRGATESSQGTITSKNSLVRQRTGSWLQQTLERHPQAADATPQLETKCLYVQKYMHTVIALLADPGLQCDHGVLNALWQSLLPQLMELEGGLRKSEEAEGSPRPVNNVACFSATEKLCEANPRFAAYPFRHAMRRAHQEYVGDPSLLQVCLSKEHCRMISQRVHEREVYFQPGRLGHVDALSIHGVLERYAKLRQSYRQQPQDGPKMMFF